MPLVAVGSATAKESNFSESGQTWAETFNALALGELMPAGSDGTLRQI